MKQLETLTNIRNLFEHEAEDNCYKQVTVRNFGVTITFNTKVIVIEIRMS